MSIKLYRHNEIGEDVAIAKVGLFANVLHSDGTLSTHICKTITDNYTPIPEAPKMHSTAWAIMMMKKGYKVKRKNMFNYEYYQIGDGQNVIWNENKEIVDLVGMQDDWQLYEEPKPLVEKLPHEFMKDEKVLVRSLEGWSLGYFKEFNMPYNKYAINTKSSFGVCYESRCLPYEGNEHLEGTFIGEHEYGAVPKGYVPPHVPKLGDETYWVVGDEVVDFAIAVSGTVVEVHKNNIVVEKRNGSRKQYYLNGTYAQFGQRRLFHKNSTVDENGTVHEHIPTRSHYITQK